MSEALHEEGWLLQPSEERDIDVLMKWFPDEASVRIWGGPGFRFPYNRHSFAADVHWGRMMSLVCAIVTTSWPPLARSMRVTTEFILRG